MKVQGFLTWGDRAPRNFQARSARFELRVRESEVR